MVSISLQELEKAFVLFRLDGFWFLGLCVCLFVCLLVCFLSIQRSPSTKPKWGMQMGPYLCLSPCLRLGLSVCCFTGQASWLAGLQGFGPCLSSHRSKEHWHHRHTLTCLFFMGTRVFKVKGELPTESAS